MTYENKDFFMEMTDNQEYYMLRKKGNDLYIDIHGKDYFPIWTNTHSLNKYLNNSHINKNDITIFKCSLDSIKEILNNIDKNFVLINHSYMSADYKAYGDVVNIKQLLDDLYKTGNCVSPLISTYYIVDINEFQYDKENNQKNNKANNEKLHDDLKDYTIEYTNSFNATHANNKIDTITSLENIKSSLLKDILKLILLFVYNSIVIYFITCVVTGNIDNYIFSPLGISQMLIIGFIAFVYSIIELFVNNTDEGLEIYVLVKVTNILRILVTLGGIVPLLIAQFYYFNIIPEFLGYILTFVSITFAIRYAYLYACSSPDKARGKTLRKICIYILSNIRSSQIIKHPQNEKLLNKLNSIIITSSENNNNDKYTITKLHQYFNADKSNMHELVFNLKYKDYHFYNELLKNDKLSETDKIVIKENANIIKDWDNHMLDKCLKMIADKEKYKDLQKQKQSYEASRNKFDVDTSSHCVVENIKKMSTDIKDDFNK